MDCNNPYDLFKREI